ncbi:TonB-dependent receptor [Aquimarina longa]|uniref:TonB-dependent receptor n=1 Tax=Aquimarina longa TaxID=1080221 RepID=UPI0007862D45|nr:TonB-dependent receptor [Aquimarina longa]
MKLQNKLKYTHIKTIQLWGFLFFLHLGAIAQNQLQQQVTINSKKLSVAQLITQIEKQTNLNFVYSSVRTDVDKKVNVKNTTTTVKKLLQDVSSKSSLKFSLTGNQIIINKLLKGDITGDVKDAKGNPLEMANVIIKGTNKGTMTNQKGNYTLNKVAEGQQVITVSLIGYQTIEMKVKVLPNQTINVPRIILQEKSQQLGEVMVKTDDKNKFIVTDPSSSLRLNTEVVKLPQNIQIINENVLESQNLINMRDDVMRNVSGTIVGNAWLHDVSIYMRGFPIPGFRNGMFVEMTYGPLPEDMATVETIEFVKGPSGFMLSSGEPGGFYNVVTKKPTPYKRNELSLTFGSFNSHRAALSSGGSLTKDKKLQYHITGVYNYNESHKKYDERKTIGIIPSLKYEFSDKTSILTELTYNKAKMRTGIENVILPRNVDGNLKTLPRDFTFMDENWPKSDIEEVSLFTKISHKFNDNWTINGQHMYMKYGIDGFYTYVKDGVKDNGDTNRTLSTWDGLTNNQLGQIYGNGKFSTGFITHRIMGGMDYRHMKSYNDFGRWFRVDIDKNAPFNIYNPVYGNAVIPEFRHLSNTELKEIGSLVGAKSISFYLQDEMWMLNDKLRITLAARHTNIENFAYGNTVEEEKFTPRIGVSFDMLPNITVYGLFDQSFIPNYGRSLEDKPFDPVDARDIEAGIKGSWFDKKLNTSLTAYQITKENILVPHPEQKLAVEGYNVQIGEVRSQGIEFDMQGQLTSDLNLIFNYAYTEPKVTKDTNPARVNQPLEGHAKHVTNGWLSYTFKKTSFLDGFGASIGYRYAVDNTQWDWKDNAPIVLPDYFRLDGAINWKNDKFAVSVNIYNILDEYLLYSGGGYYNSYVSSSEPGINGRITLQYKF